MSPMALRCARNSASAAPAAAEVPGRRAACGSSAAATLPLPTTNALRTTRAPPPPAALPEWLARVVDFESWAPRSSRMWRLDQYSYERSTSSTDEELERERQLDGLQARVAAMRRTGGGKVAAAEDEDEEEGQADMAAISSSAAPLTAASIARAAAGAQEEAEEEEQQEEAMEEVPPLSAPEIRMLLLKKWEKSYDMAFVRRDLPGMKPFIALNVYCHALENRSFRLTEEQYEEKLEGIAARLSILGQTARVRAFLEAPAKSSKGLPRRPTMGTAVSIALDVTQAQIEAYFTGPF